MKLKIYALSSCRKLCYVCACSLSLKHVPSLSLPVHLSSFYICYLPVSSPEFPTSPTPLVLCAVLYILEKLPPTLAFSYAPHRPRSQEFPPKRLYSDTSANE